MLFKLASVVALASYVSAECPNACSGHGQCSNFDMCTCNRNFEGNDCSLRTCPFDRAHVDTAKGDLNGDQAISSSAQIAGSQVYPLGTPELYPIMSDGNGGVLTDTAHEYMECSNKGICDRNTGTCECFEGYDGGACQRASCPNSCSGHGTCETIADLAFSDFENIYALWDKDSTMGCACDSGYSGPDCSERMCKYGIDPLYTDDTTARVQETHIRIETSLASTLYGTYALKFYDVFGEDYVTTPIIAGIDDTDQCTLVTDALKALPNDVIETVACTSSAVSTNKGFDLKLDFITNPGKLKQMEIIDKLDGTQSTLRAYTGADPSTAVAASDGFYTTSVYQTGTTGAFEDYFASKCEGVTATVEADATAGAFDATAKPGSIAYLDQLSAGEQGLLKACLGDSDGDVTNNVEVYNWDMGYLKEMEAYDNVEYTIGAFPHAIMTVPVTQTTNMAVDSDYYGISTDSGDFHLLWYDPSEANSFRIANFGESSAHVSSYIHTTNGVVQQLGWEGATANQGAGDNRLTNFKNESRVVGMFNQYSNMILTNVDASCESGNTDRTLQACLSKGDKLFVVDGCWGDGKLVRSDGLFDDHATAGEGASFWGDNELYGCADVAGTSTGTGNLYTIEKIYTRPFSFNTTAYNERSSNKEDPYDGREDRFVIKVDQNIGWDGSRAGDPDNTGGRNSGVVILFKFSPVTAGSYTYVSQCSNRGACNNEEGLCECFKGYHGDACQKQSSLAQ